MKITADTFSPEWEQGVYQMFGPSGLKQPLNPNYFLTRESADQLAAILADLSPSIVEADPYPVAMGTVEFFDAEGKVTLALWLRFPSGAAVNAGTEAAYWTSAPDGRTAEQRCRQDIQAAERQYADEGDGQYPVQLRS